MSLPIILGSASRWRRTILAKILGVNPEEITTMAADIDEKAIRHNDPQIMTVMIAKSKAKALLPLITTPSILICSDQVIVCNGEIREKPVDEQEAKEFLRSYSRFPAQAIDGLVVVNTQTGEWFEGVATAKQYFKEISETLISRLIAQGDIFDCAGGFVTEGMEEVNEYVVGEVETIEGLPVELTKELIARAQGSCRS